MRVLIHDRPGHPFQIQLSRHLAARGFEVLHSYGVFFQSPRGALCKQEDDPGTLQIVGLHLKKPFAKYAFVRRLFQEIAYSSLLVDQIRSFQPEVVIFGNTPSEAQAIVYWRCRRMGIRFVFWVQDMYGIAIHKILSKRLPVLGAWIGRFYVWLDKYLLRRSARVVLITEDFRPLLQQWGIDHAKTCVIPNWAPLVDLPVRPKNNPWSRAQGLADKFCLLYSGTLGMKHNPDLLVRLAEHFRHDDNIRIVIISEGLGANWLKTQQREKDLHNLVLLDYQPFDQFADVLGTADVLLAILEPDAGIFSVPSKVLSYLCAQRPLLLAVPPENLAARIVARSEAGVVVPPKDAVGFIAAANQLYENADLRHRLGENGRHYAERHFDIEQITDQFVEIIQSA